MPMFLLHYIKPPYIYLYSHFIWNFFEKRLKKKNPFKFQFVIDFKLYGTFFSFDLRFVIY